MFASRVTGASLMYTSLGGKKIEYRPGVTQSGKDVLSGPHLFLQRCLPSSSQTSKIHKVKGIKPLALSDFGCTAAMAWTKARYFYNKYWPNAICIAIPTGCSTPRLPNPPEKLDSERISKPTGYHDAKPTCRIKPGGERGGACNS